jgi:hypothetical protein
VAGHIFQARPVWIYTQSNITNFIYIYSIYKRANWATFLISPWPHIYTVLLLHIVCTQFYYYGNRSWGQINIINCHWSACLRISFSIH